MCQAKEILGLGSVNFRGHMRNVAILTKLHIEMNIMAIVLKLIYSLQETHCILGKAYEAEGGTCQFPK